MFGQDDNQQNQQDQTQQQDDTQQQNQSPAAPPPDHQFAAPKPAYEEAVFGNTSSIDDATASSTTPAIPQQDTTQATAPANEDELLHIKKQALEQLSPLVGQLEQSPEEKFHTTMRIIQASDNHSLIKEAYNAAKDITDDKIRAQALLDIINEINYFTKDEASENDSPEHLAA